MKRPNPNFLDRVIAAISPARAVRRLAAKAAYSALTGGYYEGGRHGRRALTTWRPGGGSADRDIVPDLQHLRNDTRSLARRSPVAAGAINRIETNVVGPGLRAQPQIDRELLGLDIDAAQAWERAADREFRLWSESRDCDATGVQDFAGLQALVFRGMLESGDDFVIPRRREPSPDRPIGLTLQVFEADQVSTPNQGAEGRATGESGNRIVDGVEMDNDGRVVAYHFRKEHPGNLTGTGREWSRVEARADNGRLLVNHIYDRKRIGQTRGVPILAPVIEPLRQLQIYSEAELYAAVISAMITIVNKFAAGEGLQPVQPTGDTGAKASDKDYKMAPGLIFDLDNEDNIEVPSLGRPNANFDPFFLSVIRQIGAALGVPSEVLIMSFTASYSASRAALEQAWQLFRMQRTWLVRHFCKWVYQEFLMEAIGAGRLAAPGFFQDPLIRQAWCGAVWVGAARISIDPFKENQADALAEDRGWKTATEITAEKTGGDWERKNEQRSREIRLQQESGAPQRPAEVTSPTPEPGAPTRRENRPENEEDEED